MNKDLLTTIIGMVGAAALAAKEYLATQATGQWDLNNWIGMGGAVLVALFGYWSKKPVEAPASPVVEPKPAA